MFLFCCFHPWRPKSALPICRITVSSSCTVIFVLTCIACLTLILALFLEPSSGHHYVSFTWKRETTKRNLFRLNQPRISFISDKVCIQTYTAWAGHTFCINQLNYLSPRVGSHHSNHSKLRTPYSERLCPPPRPPPALVYRYPLWSLRHMFCLLSYTWIGSFPLHQLQRRLKKIDTPHSLLTSSPTCSRLSNWHDEKPGVLKRGW